MCSSKQESSIAIRTTRDAKPPVRKGLTFWLFFPTVLIVVVSFAAFCTGAISWWQNWLFATPLYYFLIIFSHDALHSTAHPNRLANKVVGWIGTQMFAVPFPVVRRAHLSHHAKEGADDDIEQFAYNRGPTLPIRILFGNWMYYEYLPKCPKKDWVLAAATVMVTFFLFMFFPRQTFLGWFLPMQTGTCYIMVTTIWIPHGPYSKWWMDNMPFVTGFHEDHHAQPNYPFHQIAQQEVREYARLPVRRVLAAGRGIPVGRDAREAIEHGIENELS